MEPAAYGTRHLDVCHPQLASLLSKLGYVIQRRNLLSFLLLVYPQELMLRGQRGISALL